MGAMDPFKMSYCGSTITWSISTNTYNNYPTYDAQALAKYKEVYERWIASGGSNNSNPTNDCLGILRNVACAHYFPICDSTVGDKTCVSVRFCSYLSDRCSDETELYTLFCSNSGDGCSFSYRLSPSAILFVFLFIGLLIF